MYAENLKNFIDLSSFDDEGKELVTSSISIVGKLENILTVKELDVLTQMLDSGLGMELHSILLAMIKAKDPEYYLDQWGDDSEFKEQDVE